MAVMDTESLLLIAEDNDNHFLLFKIYLEQKGITHHLVRFVDGQSLLDFLAAIDSFGLPPQRNFVLVLDFDMPKVSGLQVLEQIKQKDNLQNIPVIMLSASTNRQTIDRCYALGCCACLTKPLHGNEFIDVLRNLCTPAPTTHTGEIP
jgi:CheY-like chemotaxis protein